MPVPFRPTPCARQGGMTLTELAIVMIIIAVVLGGIWAGLNELNTRHRLTQAVDQVWQSSAAIRNTYAGQGTNANPVPVSIFPGDMLVGGVIQNIWGLNVTANVTGTATPPQFTLTFPTPTVSDCAALVMAIPPSNPNPEGLPTSVTIAGNAAISFTAGMNLLQTATTQCGGATTPINVVFTYGL